MPHDLLILWLAAFPLMGSPGPATMSLAGIGAAFGTRRGLSYLAGIIIGTSGVLVLVSTGVTGLILAEPALVTAISIIAAVYIVYLAYKIATAPVASKASAVVSAPSFPSGFFLAIANPKAFAAIGAVFSSNTLIDSNLAWEAVGKVAALIPVIVIVNTAWLIFGSALSSLLRDPTTGRIANIVFATMLIVSVVLVLIG